MSKAFGEWLKKKLDDEGLNISGLAVLMRLSPSSVWAWRKGKAEPNAANVAKMAKALSIPTDEIYRALGALLIALSVKWK